MRCPMTKRKNLLSIGIVLALSTGGCAAGLDQEPGDQDGSTADEPGAAGKGDDGDEELPETGEVDTIDEVAAAPEGVSMDSEALQASCLTFYTADEGAGSTFEAGLQAAVAGPKLVYLNRSGGTYTRGRNDSSRNVSSIPKRTVNVAAYEGSNADWQNVVSCVVDQFKSYNVRITDQDPGDVAHIEAVVGDGPESVDLGQGVGGVSPFSCGVIDRSIVYVFSRVLRSVRSECEVIAHEIGHSLGLEHEFLCEDPMTYLNGCGAKSFQDKAASCGTSRAVDCECGSRTQNTVQKLLSAVGAADATPPPPPPAEPPPPPPATDALPTVRVASPASGATLPGNRETTVTIEAADDVGLTDVRLLWEFQGLKLLSCANAAPPVSCTIGTNTFTFKFPVGTGPRAFVAEAIDTAQQSARSARVELTFSDGAAVDAPPKVAITQPTQGSTLQRGTRFAVRANASDDGSVREVNLIWQSPAGVQTIRLENLGGGAYGIDLGLSAQAAPGPRALTVTAMDDAGQTSSSDAVTVQLR